MKPTNSATFQWILNIFGSIKALSFIGAANSFPLLAQLLQKCISPSVRAKRTAHFKFAEDKAARRMGAETDRKDFMSYILWHNDEKGMSKAEIAVNSATFVLAGSETTATLLSGTTFLLLKNPAALKKLTDEVRSTFANEDEIDFKSASSLKYLIACLKEGFRVYPPVPVGLARVVPHGGDYVMGHFVPGGVSIPYLIHLPLSIPRES
jgi:cytochrome P450